MKNFFPGEIVKCHYSEYEQNSFGDLDEGLYRKGNSRYNPQRMTQENELFTVIKSKPKAMAMWVLTSNNEIFWCYKERFITIS